MCLTVGGHDNAQGLASVQQVKSLVDLCQLEPVGDVLCHPKLALHVAVHQLGHIHARFVPAKGRPPPHAACVDIHINTQAVQHMPAHAYQYWMMDGLQDGKHW